MKLTPKTRIHDLIERWPFLIEFLVARNATYKPLASKVMRATVGRVATLARAATMGSEDPLALMQAIASEVKRRTGEDVEVQGSDAPDPEKLATMKKLIGELHDGKPLEEARAEFNAMVEGVDATEIAHMEEELIKGGLPVTEVQRLCDLHVGVFKDLLDEGEKPEAPPGHPVHTYMAENAKLGGIADELTAVLSEIEGDRSTLLARKESVERILGDASGFENHYVRKENQLFPLLEKHGVTGPSQVMWGVHDEIRGHYKNAREALAAGDVDGLVESGTAFARGVVEMIYKEDNILYPLALSHLSVSQWADVRAGEDELGYAFDGPAAPWPAQAHRAAETPSAFDGLLDVKTGRVSLDQLNLILTHLPVDLSFVDENDEVRFYSEGPDRIFPRSPAVIGRRVQNCHPPKSVHIVERILSEMKASQRDAAEFWIQLSGRFIHIRYFAVRDAQGAYRGCLEVSQDVTAIRALEGQKRLLDD